MLLYRSLLLAPCSIRLLEISLNCVFIGLGSHDPEQIEVIHPGIIELQKPSHPVLNGNQVAQGQMKERLLAGKDKILPVQDLTRIHKVLKEDLARMHKPLGLLRVADGSQHFLNM